MERNIGVAMTNPMSSYLEEQLQRRFNLFKLWKSPVDSDTANSIRAVVCSTQAGANADLIDSFPALEIVATFSVGLDKIDLKKCMKREIRVTNTPDVLTDDVADVAIGLAIAVLRKICECDRFVRSGAWLNREFGLSTKFSGKSVGILGLGRIGLAIAKRAQAFGCTINYFSRTEKHHHTDYKYFPTLLDLAKNSEIMFVSCALTEETKHIVNREVLDALGPNAILINVSRGAHVNESELISALLEGRLGGAGLDVFENEPHVPEPLIHQLQNTVLLPHVGSDTIDTDIAMADLVIANLEAHFKNQPLITPCYHRSRV